MHFCVNLNLLTLCVSVWQSYGNRRNCFSNPPKNEKKVEILTKCIASKNTAFKLIILCGFWLMFTHRSWSLHRESGVFTDDDDDDEEILTARPRLYWDCERTDIFTCLLFMFVTFDLISKPLSPINSTFLDRGFFFISFQLSVNVSSDELFCLLHSTYFHCIFVYWTSLSALKCLILHS